MAATAAPETVMDLRAYKFRLDPNIAQTQALSQAAGAARVAYNMVIAHNRAAHDEGRRRVEELTASGVDPEEAAARVRAQRTTDPALAMVFTKMGFNAILTAERRRHQAAADVIAAGADPAEVWAGQRYEHPWLHEANRRVMVSGVEHATAAFTNWVNSYTGKRAGRRVGYPRFKKKHASRDSFTIPAPESMGGKGAPYKRGEARKGLITDYRHLRLGFLGTIRTHQHTRRLVRACERGAVMRSFTVSRAADRWYVSILVATPRETAPEPTRAQRARGGVGVDLGVNNLAALSTGELVDNPRYGRRGAEKLRRAQRAYARTKKGSQGRARAARRVARLHHLVALQRSTVVNTLTKRLATGYAVVAIEDLNVSGMTRSAKGTVENPGKNVAAKSGLNRSVLDAAFGELRRQLEYKTAWYGSSVATIGRYAPSSKACSSCGAVKPKLSLGERVYDCDQCGMRLDRDVNAARNILAWATGGRDQPPAPGMGADGRGDPVPPSPPGEGPPVPAQRSAKTGYVPYPATAAEQSAAHPHQSRTQIPPN